jgi:hypothetical protein
VLAAQGTTVRFGDILIVRSGYGKALAQTTAAQRAGLPRGLPPGLVGVDQGDAVLRWIWEHFAAVAGDQPAFECWREFHFSFFSFVLPKRAFARW